MCIKKSIDKKFSPFGMRRFFGISSGCFFGTGYGLVIGFGKIYNISNSVHIICPSRNPFIHSGLLTGCYCGIALGVGFGSGLVNTIGITEKIRFTFPKFNHSLFSF
nr:hypothetical protein 1634Bnrm1_p057 [Cryptomonas sp.]